MKKILLILSSCMFMSIVAFAAIKTISYPEDYSACIKTAGGSSTTEDCSEESARKVANRICVENNYDRASKYEVSRNCVREARMVHSCTHKHYGLECRWETIFLPYGSNSCFTNIECISQGNPISINPYRPTKIEVEDYSAYYDTTYANIGNAMTQQNGVDLEYCSEGGYNVAYIENGEWLEYDINVEQGRYYTFMFRAARDWSPAPYFHLELNGYRISSKIEIPYTGGFQNWTTVFSDSVYLPEGRHKLRLVMDGNTFNLDWMMFK